MAWFRGGTAILGVDSMCDLYGQTSEIPRRIAIETSAKAIKSDRKNPHVNVVLYNDEELVDEQNDFYFDALEDAVAFCFETYGVTPNDWLDLGIWREVTDTD